MGNATRTGRRRAMLAALLGLLGVGPLSLVPGRAASAAACAGVEMPERLELSGTPLVLNGMGLREATFLNVDVYVAGLYLLRRSRDPEEILSRDEKRYMALELVRNVSREEMMDALSEGMRKSAGDDFPRMRGRMERLAGMLPPLEKGSRIHFAYTPDRGTELVVDDEARGVLEGADFARAFFGIWLGEHSPDPDLRRGLLGGGC